MLQLGFLKLLKGTPIKAEYDVEFCMSAPYEVISTPTMSEEDLAELKQIEWVNERLYNSGKFSNTLDYLLRRFSTPYDFFLSVSAHFDKLNIHKDSYESNLYEGLLSFVPGDTHLKEILRFDYLVTNNSRKIPRSLQHNHSEKFKKFLSLRKKSASYIYDEFNRIPPLNSAFDIAVDGEDGAPTNAATYIVKFDYLQKNRVNGKYDYSIVGELNS